jgi:hypothetical protein
MGESRETRRGFPWRLSLAAYLGGLSPLRMLRTIRAFCSIPEKLNGNQIRGQEFAEIVTGG